MANITVKNAADLATKLAAAKGGETFLLAPGNYGLVAIKRRNFATPITIQSASGTDPAKIVNLAITESSGIRVRGLDLGAPLADGEAQKGARNCAQVTNSNRISFDRVHVYGSLDGDPTNDRDGIGVRGSHHVTVSNSTFEQLGRGMGFGSSQDITVSNNVFRNMSTDGIDFAQVQRVKVDGNSFTNFKPKDGDHPDAIQFWTAGTPAASTDISITNNQIMMGGPIGTQGIFMRDEVGTLPYERVKIDNNLIYINNGYNGIGVLGGKNVTVTGNSVLSQTSDTLKLRINLTNVAGAQVSGNVTDQLLATGSTNVTYGTNYILCSDPSKTALIPNLLNGIGTTATDLVIEGMGYQLPQVTAPTSLRAGAVAAPAPKKSPVAPVLAAAAGGRGARKAMPAFTAPTLGERLDTPTRHPAAATVTPFFGGDAGAMLTLRNSLALHEFGLAVSPMLGDRR